MSAAHVADALHDLQKHLRLEQILVFGPLYDQRRRVWNAAIDHRPAVVVAVRSAADVQLAVRVAQTHGLALSVRGGGHDWAGRAVRDDGLLIDLSGLRGVRVDPGERTAVAGGGAIATDVVAAAAPHGLSPVTGSVGVVGLAGLTLGGGYGPLSGRFGLALDNLLGADVVLADGRLVSTDATREPELFWALRGGGGNFGVVTSLRVRLHPVGELLGGLLLFPWAQAGQVLARLDRVLANGPDELTVQAGTMSFPDGAPVLYLAPTWSGRSLGAGQRAVDGLRGLGTPLASMTRRFSHSELLGQFDEHVLDGHHYATVTRTVARLTPSVAAALVEAGDRRTSPSSRIVVHHFHGAATRVPVGSTAFGLRQPHFVIEIQAGWAAGDDGAVHRAWAESVSAALAPHALPGGYPNLLGPDSHDQAEHAYGRNATRLLAAKHRYDPDGVFAATPLPRELSASLPAAAPTR